MREKRGFTLIEMVISIVIVGLCAIPVALMYQQASAGSYKVRALTQATALAEEKMDEVLRLGYANIAAVSQTAFPAPFAAYNFQVIVNYVNPAALNTAVDPTITDYKRVQVRVTGAGAINISLVSLLTNTAYVYIGHYQQGP